MVDAVGQLPPEACDILAAAARPLLSLSHEPDRLNEEAQALLARLAKARPKPVEPVPECED